MALIIDCDTMRILRRGTARSVHSTHVLKDSCENRESTLTEPILTQPCTSVGSLPTQKTTLKWKLNGKTLDQVETSKKNPCTIEWIPQISRPRVKSKIITQLSAQTRLLLSAVVDQPILSDPYEGASPTSMIWAPMLEVGSSLCEFFPLSLSFFPSTGNRQGHCLC